MRWKRSGVEIWIARCKIRRWRCEIRGMLASDFRRERSRRGARRETVIFGGVTMVVNDGRGAHWWSFGVDVIKRRRGVTFVRLARRGGRRRRRRWTTFSTFFFLSNFVPNLLTFPALDFAFPFFFVIFFTTPALFVFPVVTTPQFSPQRFVSFAGVANLFFEGRHSFEPNRFTGGGGDVVLSETFDQLVHRKRNTLLRRHVKGSG